MRFQKTMFHKANRILRMILEKNLTEFTRREDMRHCQEFKCVGEIQPVLDFLEANYYISAVKIEPTHKKGRTPVPKYIVNPEVRACYYA